MDDTYTAALAAQREAVATNEDRFLRDMFAVPTARRSDPDTSHAAAASMAEEAHHQRAAIMAALTDFGPLCNDQLDERLGWRVGTASRRTAELIRAGLVVRTDHRHVTRTGRGAFLLEAA